MLSENVDVSAHLMGDEWKSLMSIGQAFAAHETVRQSDREYARSPVHANSAEGFNDRVRRTVAGVFHHINPLHADLYFNEIGIRWSQRVLAGHAMRRRRKGREVVKPLWSRIAPRSNCRRYSGQPSDGNRVEPLKAASRSAAQSLSLVDKGGVRKTHFRVVTPGCPPPPGDGTRGCQH